jgi:hypothetical protein
MFPHHSVRANAVLPDKVILGADSMGLSLTDASATPVIHAEIHDGVRLLLQGSGYVVEPRPLVRPRDNAVR